MWCVLNLLFSILSSKGRQSKLGYTNSVTFQGIQCIFLLTPQFKYILKMGELDWFGAKKYETAAKSLKKEGYKIKF